jgi:hypothetical protein
MSAKLFASVGHALYSFGYQSELSRRLKVGDRTIRRWVAGEADIPHGVWGELQTLAHCRIDEIQAALAQLYGRD